MQSPVPNSLKTPSSVIEHHLSEHNRVIAALTPMTATLAEAGALCAEAIRGGHKILLCGNGGSASDAQHIAAELVGRFVADRRALPAIALTTDTSALTAIANDYGYEHVFERQVEGLGTSGDVLIAISTSGHSANVNRATQRARAMGLKVVGFAGKDGGQLADLADIALVVPSTTTARIQECHILMGHMLCAVIEQVLELS